jgi:hypothetical protein
MRSVFVGACQDASRCDQLTGGTAGAAYAELPGRRLPPGHPAVDTLSSNFESNGLKCHQDKTFEKNHPSVSPQ